ncbi:hypothetical protein L228DRAFT_242634 [Xylona heveae TC161]|uniref:Non-specific serine/threonine protein kinase n=1 Tax=Xylona heveae (strain CBS 132557 / TC161) TaxID=1328760 RepID=A0A165JGB4_XYLHT|nr:hypothetical protein L228DRAFT_242634 [Xylona heveae TC161]KZF26201.1 hypothetical protein L228DRAFT_242634 [Xylona heveae TC161]
MRVRSYITWFDEVEFIGREITFTEPFPSTWRLEQKLREHERFASEDDVKSGLDCEAQAVFVCSRVAGQVPQEAIVKIRLQIPWIGTVNEPPHTRAKQAKSDWTFFAKRELEALSILKHNNCSSSPALLGWKREEQDAHMWVPGGYMLCILMERLRGVNPEPYYWGCKMDREERDELRAAFKKAYLECVACGVVHGDCAIRNLVWDRELQKCYLVDFEIFYRPSKRLGKWQDIDYIEWNLAECSDGDLHDMSTWKL